MNKTDQKEPYTPRYSIPRGGYEIRAQWKYNDYRIEGDVAVLNLKNRAGEKVAEARIDVADLDAVIQAGHWIIAKTNTKELSYARSMQRGIGSRIGRRKPAVYLHRFLMQPDIGLEVDHIDGDGLNCVRSNMRLATRGENSRNKPFHRRVLLLQGAIQNLMSCTHNSSDCPCRTQALTLVDNSS